MVTSRKTSTIPRRTEWFTELSSATEWRGPYLKKQQHVYPKRLYVTRRLTTWRNNPEDEYTNLHFGVTFGVIIGEFIFSRDFNGNSNAPNIGVEWEAFFFRIREVPRSNLVAETGYPDWSYS
jgi:hypothetical protein